MIYEVKDGVRTLQFAGIKLSHSSSRKYGSSRWVEFDLYKTQSNQYIISRIGHSIAYHNETCKTVRRNYLEPVDESKIPANYVPCEICKPRRLDPEQLMFPEKERPWAQVSSTAKGVVESLMKFDENDVAYLTNVARDLLEDAAKVDNAIKDAYLVEIVE